jgi:PEP-CTERM motif-containing protein
MKNQNTPRFINGRVLDALALARNAMMQPKIVKAVLLAACAVGMLNATANGANIIWQAPTTISGASDVSTLGTLVGTWAPGDDAYNPDSLPVNGVTFNAYGSGPFNSFISISGNDDHYTGYNSPGTADNNYNTILKAAVYSYGSAISLTWGGLTPGDTYLLEFWVQDGRNSVTAERSETLTGGANTSAALAYGSGSTGPGQYILGAFVADGTATETLTLNASGGNDIGPSAQINLLQLRDITPVPEPSTLAFLAMGAGAVLFRLRRKASAT